MNSMAAGYRSKPGNGIRLDSTYCLLPILARFGKARTYANSEINTMLNTLL